MNVTPRVAGLLAVLALGPVAAYAALDEAIAVVALVNVVLITVSLAIALSPHEPLEETVANGS
jgi:hypothetical protein